MSSHLPVRTGRWGNRALWRTLGGLSEKKTDSQMTSADSQRQKLGRGTEASRHSYLFHLVSPEGCVPTGCCPQVFHRRTLPPTTIFGRSIEVIRPPSCVTGKWRFTFTFYNTNSEETAPLPQHVWCGIAGTAAHQYILTEHSSPNSFHRYRIIPKVLRKSAQNSYLSKNIDSRIVYFSERTTATFVFIYSMYFWFLKSVSGNKCEHQTYFLYSML